MRISPPRVESLATAPRGSFKIAMIHVMLEEATNTSGCFVGTEEPARFGAKSKRGILCANRGCHKLSGEWASVRTVRRKHFSRFHRVRRPCRLRLRERKRARVREGASEYWTVNRRQRASIWKNALYVPAISYR